VSQHCTSLEEHALAQCTCGVHLQHALFTALRALCTTALRTTAHSVQLVRAVHLCTSAPMQQCTSPVGCLASPLTKRPIEQLFAPNPMGFQLDPAFARLNWRLERRLILRKAAPCTCCERSTATGCAHSAAR